MNRVTSQRSNSKYPHNSRGTPKQRSWKSIFPRPGGLLRFDASSNTTSTPALGQRRQKIASGLTGELVAPLNRQGAMLRKKCQRSSSAQAALISSSPAMQRSGMPM